jgi:hypothetical protein
MLNIKNVDIIRHHIPINDWTITHIFKNYVGDNGKDYYIFQLERTGGIASTTISLEKEATNGTIDLVTNEKRMLYELKGPAGTMNLYLSQIKSLGEFINKMKLVC